MISWSVNTSELLKKAQQRPSREYFLRILRRNNITQSLLVSFYRASIESIPWAYGTPAAQRLREKRSRGSSTPPKRLSAALSPHWKNYTVPAASKKPRTLLRTHTIPVTPCLSCCPQAEGTDHLTQGLTDSNTAFIQLQ